MGQSLPVAPGPARRQDVASAGRRAHDRAGARDRPFDIVHVHEPFAPSASAAALRHSHALNIGTFIRPPSASSRPRWPGASSSSSSDGSTPARRLRRHAQLVSSFFPGEYELIGEGADLARYAPAGRRRGPVEIVFAAEEERAALRLFLRALRQLPLELSWHATVWSPRQSTRCRGSTRLFAIASPSQTAGRRTSARRLPRRRVLRRLGGPRAGLAHAREGDRGGARFPSRRGFPSTRRRSSTASAACCSSPGTPRCSRRSFGDSRRDGELSARCGRAASNAARTSAGARVADRVGALVPRGSSSAVTVHRRAARRRQGSGWAGAISSLCDLHMHTDHSPDCATPVDVLLETASGGAWARSR